MNKVYYKSVYGRVYVVLGIIFSVIFITGYWVVGDYWMLTYLLFSGFMVYIGVSTQRQPYAKYGPKALILYRLTGSVRKKIEYQNPSEITFKNDKLYHKGKKLKLNSWFVEKADWKRLAAYYSGKDSEELLDELKDDEI